MSENNEVLNPTNSKDKEFRFTSKKVDKNGNTITREIMVKNYQAWLIAFVIILLVGVILLLSNAS